MRGKAIFEGLLDILDQDGNKSTLVWNIAHHFYLSCFRRLVNFTLDRTPLGVLIAKTALFKAGAFQCYQY